DSFLRVQRGTSGVFGDYLRVIAPILSVQAADQEVDDELESASVPGGPRLLGYVAVGVSQAAEAAELRQVNYVVMGVGCVLVLVSFPLSYVLVRLAFQPIRQLVSATQSIAAGDLDTQVAIDRRDVIGVLARSFNEMVSRVKSQQQDLEAANRNLE